MRALVPLRYCVSALDRGLEIAVAGFNEKLLVRALLTQPSSDLTIEKVLCLVLRVQKLQWYRGSWTWRHSEGKTVKLGDMEKVPHF